jgi:hypothetical protein
VTIVGLVLLKKIDFKKILPYKFKK